MKKQKVVTVVAGDDKTINDLLETYGWLVINMVSENVSVSSPDGYSPRTEKGKIVFLLEKEI